MELALRMPSIARRLATLSQHSQQRGKRKAADQEIARAGRSAGALAISMSDRLIASITRVRARADPKQCARQRAGDDSASQACATTLDA